MLSEVELDALARKISTVLYRQLVENVAVGKRLEWTSDDFLAGADAQEKRIATFFKTLNKSQVAMSGDVIHRTASDTVIALLGLLTGEVDVGLPGIFALTYEGHDIGPYLKAHMLMLDEATVKNPSV
jgi:hypothetical protein